MDPAGLINKIFQAVVNIDVGRKGLSTDGKEHYGRISYEDGISTALSSFKEAQIFADPQTLILAELAFLQQELQFCHDSDTDTKSSLVQAVQSFEDALRSLEVVEDVVMYQGAEKTYPVSPKYRIQGFPRDAFHIACMTHRTRLHNVLRAPGINMIEKAVLNQRAANMTTAQGGYIEKQKKSLK
ncbi:MAG: hypothetical protein LBP60_03235 [Spirochaetaceae bacterium]|jgi:hypothetical protein|nr:hypothetical protein [Spirochaetaceae bacterium]